MSDIESDEDLLTILLANIESEEATTDNNETAEQIKAVPLKELDYNFIDSVEADSVYKTDEIKSTKLTTESDFYKDEHANSSDDEDKKYFEKQQYSEYGREIKHLLKNKGPDHINFSLGANKNNYNNNDSSNNINCTNKSNAKVDNPLSSSVSTCSPKSDTNSIKRDVYSDPIFGIKMIRPLISSAELMEKMEGRKTIRVSEVKLHLMNQSAQKSDEDWVIGGVILNKSLTRTSQKGNQYCIWKITDLSTEMKTVSVFLFNTAFKQFWKVSNGTVVCILNPSVLESRDDKDLATLSVNSMQKILVLGFSRDLGKCKSIKKNGEPCTAPVNLSNCEYCLFHIKQEYGKYARRSELGSTPISRVFGSTKNSFKKTGVSQQRHPDALPFIAIPAKRNEALYKKDCERLALLRGQKPTNVDKNKHKYDLTPEMKIKATTIEFSAGQAKKDAERLTKLQKLESNENVFSPAREEIKFKLPIPKLGNGMKGGRIDFTEPVSKEHVNRAKLNAIEWVKRNGCIKKSNPNKVRAEKDVLQDKGLKRKRENERDETCENDKSVKQIDKRFLEMMEMKSLHCDLIENRESEEMEKYFNKSESKERLEIKMLETYKINCKAVYCSVCKYVSFSKSDLCKTLQHPTKVINGVKRFFKCGNCQNRTVSLDRIPENPCKKCSSVKWVRTTMMDENKTKIKGPKLCIRGGEEKFLGSAVTDASLDLLIPDST